MLRNLVKDSFIYSAGRFASNILGVILLPFYTRMLSPGDYGTLDYLNVTVVLLHMVLSVQVSQGLARYFVTHKSPVSKKSFASTALVHYVLVFTVCSGVALLFRREISELLFESDAHSTIVGVAGIYAFAYSLFIFEQNLLKWRFESTRFAIAAVSHVVLSATFILMFVGYFKIGVVGVFLGYSLSYGTLLIPMFYWTRTSFDVRFISKQSWLKMARFGAPLVFSAAAFYVLQFTDRYLIEALMDLDSLGLYSLGAKIASIVFLLLAGFQMAWGPFVYQNFEKEITKIKIANVFNHIVVISMGVVLSISIFSPEILFFFTTEKFYASYVVIPYLASAAVLANIGNYFAVGFGIAKKNFILMWIHIAGAVLNIVLNIVFIRLFGIEGAAIATALSLLLFPFIKISISNRFYPVPLKVAMPLLLSLYVVIAILAFRLFLGPEISVETIAIKTAMIAGFLVLVLLSKLINFPYVRDLLLNRA